MTVGLVAVLFLAAAPGGCSLAGLDGGSHADDGGRMPDAQREAGAHSDADTGADQRGCVPAPEDCTNGVDDDCNGLVDCADPACKSAGFACTAGDVPAGWTLVAYSADKRPICPPWFADEQAIVSDISAAPASCTCVCSGAAAQCVGQTVYSYSSNACTTSSPITVNVNNGACSPISTSLAAGYEYQLDQLGPEPQAQQGTCTGSGMVMGSPATPTLRAGATCGVASPSSMGCSAGATCAPPAGSDFKACISHTGSVACPTFGFTTQTLVSTGTPGYVDGRACGACSCATSLSCGAASSVALYGGSDCTGGAYGVGIGCPAPVGSTSSIASYTVGFSTSGSASCQPTGASPPTGSVTLDSHVETICCMP